MFSSIRNRILAASVSIVVGALSVNTGVNYLVAQRYNTQTIHDALGAVLTGHEVGIEEWVASKTKMIVSVEDAALSADPVPAFKQLAASGGFTNVYAGYADKTAKFADATGIPGDYDPTGRPWYRQAVEANRPVITPPYVDVATGKLVVTFAAPIVRNGAVKGVVSGDVAMDSVVASVKSIQPTPASFGLLVDRTGTIIAAADAKLTLKPTTDVAPELSANALASAAADANAPTLEATVGGAPKLVRARAVPGSDWVTLVALDKAEANAGMHSTLLASFGSLALMTLLTAAIIGAVTGAAFKGLARIRDAMQAIGSGTGDLTQRLPAAGDDEVAQIARSFNSFVGKINEVMVQIRDTSDAVRHAADEIASGNHDLSRRTESAAASLEETAASMEEITTTVKQSASAARQADQTAATAATAASRGGSVVADVVSTMRTIEGASGKISDIIGVIEGIAFQTNILALNAAVEAARAGEDGRGFAVVAGEVRTLAQRSAQAAKEIKELIDSSVVSVTAGASLVQQAGETMNEIVGRVTNVTRMMSEITNAADEQTRGIDEVNRAVAQLDEMVQQNAALVEQSAAAASALQSQATELTDAVGRFRIA
ncbi:MULTISPECIES: methyl-accepting chemotaxis protein [Burkholderiaceae]|uniref:Chemotaxis protein n=1 Tax=Caballeronia zhejiangensis TaxID=871203 RepID=A0A656QAF6_9BURK|nr:MULTISPECIES: methyl-accepting chemotaxis protein [Burkholderiaceae]KAK43536.1 chemotaxis protein [Caballeronia jiangsuensis]KDR26110.1 chemotaxis protein [Caballeronia zhejiangensis]KWU24292.1 chemotaxis protein [Burkholderia cenocepacia]SAL77691.1 methyl-accepting chemotaxis protein [Caballeronia peredens]